VLEDLSIIYDTVEFFIKSRMIFYFFANDLLNSRRFRIRGGCLTKRAVR